jgi:transcriptional regulator with PAS, ATPase and Fis domain
MLAIARLNDKGEIEWCSHNWPYLTGFSFLKTIGSKAQELLPGFRLAAEPGEQKVCLANRELCVHVFQIADTPVLIVEEAERIAPLERQRKEQRGEHRLLLHELPSPEMKSVLRLVAKIAPTDATVLIQGETGVGKEGIARLLHASSHRAAGPFLQLNCAAIPESLVESELFGYAPGAFTGAERGGRRGVLEEADGGTLFLDEIGELPLASQAKLLHVLQEGTFKKIGDPNPVKTDVRIVAATNRDLEALVAEGRFREDLYYRLCVLQVEIPPLREREEDIVPLIRFFLQVFQERYGLKRTLSADVEQILARHTWPGNVRQLRNVMERLVLTADETEITLFDLPKNLREKKSLQAGQKGPAWVSPRGEKPIAVHAIMPLKEATAYVEKELLRMAKELSGSTYEIAAMLGVDQSTVSRKLKQYACDAELHEKVMHQAN